MTTTQRNPPARFNRQKKRVILLRMMNSKTKIVVLIYRLMETPTTFKGKKRPTIADVILQAFYKQHFCK